MKMNYLNQYSLMYIGEGGLCWALGSQCKTQISYDASNWNSN